MRRWTVFAVIVMLTTTAACTQRPETLIDSGYDEAEMEAAIARARSEVDAFIAEFEAGNGEDFSVKAPVVDGGQTEHFWLTDISYANGQFTGLIGNDPGIVSNVKFGDSWTIAKSDISDWMFMRNDKIHGNYTMRPLLKGMPEDEAAAWREMLAEP